METSPNEPPPEPFRVQEVRRHGELFGDGLMHYLGEATLYGRPDYFDIPEEPAQKILDEPLQL
jgi:hypothetical protein